MAKALKIMLMRFCLIGWLGLTSTVAQAQTQVQGDCPSGAPIIRQGWPGTTLADRIPGDAKEVCLARPLGPPPLTVDTSNMGREEWVEYQKQFSHVVLLEVTRTTGVLTESDTWIGTEIEGRVVRRFGGVSSDSGLVVGAHVECVTSGGSMVIGGARVMTARTTAGQVSNGDRLVVFAHPGERGWACGYILKIEDQMVQLHFDDAESRMRWSGITSRSLLSLLSK